MFFFLSSLVFLFLYFWPALIESPYRNITDTHPTMRSAIKKFTNEFLRMELVDFFDHLMSKKCSPQFYVDFKYFSLAQSIELIEKWFIYQFDNEWTNVLSTVMHVVMRSDNKKNTLYFHGPASSGKTFIFFSLANLFILVGNIKNLKAGGQFPFQDVLGKRILFLDELDIPDSFVEDFKDIFAGQPMLANKKHVNATHSHYPAVIVLSNKGNIIKMEDPVWSTRVYKFTTKSYEAQIDPTLERNRR